MISSKISVESRKTRIAFFVFVLFGWWILTSFSLWAFHCPNETSRPGWEYQWCFLQAISFNALIQLLQTKHIFRDIGHSRRLQNSYFALQLETQSKVLRCGRFFKPSGLTSVTSDFSSSAFTGSTTGGAGGVGGCGVSTSGESSTLTKLYSSSGLRMRPKVPYLFEHNTHSYITRTLNFWMKTGINFFPFFLALTKDRK